MLLSLRLGPLRLKAELIEIAPFPSSVMRLKEPVNGTLDTALKTASPEGRPNFTIVPDATRWTLHMLKASKGLTSTSSTSVASVLKPVLLKIGNANVGSLGMAVPNTKCTVPLTPMMRSLRVLKVLG